MGGATTAWKKQLRQHRNRGQSNPAIALSRTYILLILVQSWRTHKDFHSRYGEVTPRHNVNPSDVIACFEAQSIGECPNVHGVHVLPMHMDWLTWMRLPSCAFPSTAVCPAYIMTAARSPAWLTRIILSTAGCDCDWNNLLRCSVLFSLSSTLCTGGSSLEFDEASLIHVLTSVVTTGLLQIDLFILMPGTACEVKVRQIPPTFLDLWAVS